MGKFEEQRAFLKTDFSVLKDIQTGARRGEPKPSAEKPVEEGAKIIELPKPDSKVLTKANIFDCIADRKSVRKYSDEKLTLAELSYLLWSTLGVTGESEGKVHRAVPSAGATYTFETYLFIQNVEGLECGIYRYLPFKNALVFLLIWQQNIRKKA